MRNLTIAALALVLIAGFAVLTVEETRGATEHKFMNVPGRSDNNPYSNAVLVGDTLYLAGDGGPHDDAAEEAHALMRSVQATLATQGLTLDDLVSVTVFCSDVSLYETFNEVYRSYFTDPDRMPARAFVGSGELLWDMRYELQGIAAK